MRRLVVLVASALFFASQAGAQQFPMLDMIANKVIQKYQNSSCPQLMAQRDQARSPEEQRAIQLLHNDPQMQQAFINQVAAPIANKLFVCGMIP
ncbi:MAG: hypothetical protein ACLQU2_00815 [Candidatus Binataceae bacterium]